MNITKTECDQWRERLLSPYTCFDAAHADFTIRLLDALEEAEEASQPIPRPFEEWHEDYGDALWWRFPLEGPPYIGSPLDEDWVDDGYFTHWTPLPTPQNPENEGE